MVKITSVLECSLAEGCGIKEGDVLLSVNGHEIRDVLDYRFYLTEKSVSLSLMRGEDCFQVDLEKDEYEDIGLDFETPLMDQKHSCENKCVFCFIDQLPKDKAIAVVCNSGQQSSQTVAVLRAAGFQAYNVQSGMNNGWDKNNLPGGKAEEEPAAE
mgnify:CR=1 FL=1